MKLERIDGHTLDLDLITGNTVIDLGCRGFLFAKLMKEFGCNVISVDAAPDVFVNVPEGIQTINKAISTKKEKVIIYNTLGESGYTSNIKKYHNKDGVEIETITLDEISPNKEYDVLKIDIEGSEYSLLSDENFKPLPKQITVEFHEHNLKQLHDDNINNVLTNLNKWYDLVYTMKNNYTPTGYYQYIDCLFIRR